MAFSVKEDLTSKTPPSLQNIFREIEEDLGIFNILWSTDLTQWAKQGVFLLNTTLTVRENDPGSHKDIGWKEFTKRTIELLNISPQPIVFMLWGNYARGYKQYIDTEHHLVLESVHPSPLSAYRSWFGNKHFSTCNDFLTKHNLKPINWKTTL